MPQQVEAENVILLKRSYEWANRVMGGAGHRVTLEDVERFFARDAVMITNDQTKCTGIEAHLKHFEEIQKKTRSVVFHPFEIVVAQGDRVGVYFKIDVRYLDGKDAKIFVAGFFRICDGRIVNFVEVAHFEGAEFKLQNH
jgi:ketosteroid isomerase-like protein